MLEGKGMTIPSADPGSSATPNATNRPALTLPGPEALMLRHAYDRAQTILEYGSGGSTVMAAEMPGKGIFSVESDKKWMAGLQSWFDVNPPPSRPVLHYANIGPTGDWGFPEGEGHWHKYPRYPLSVWDRPDFFHPDVVLIDGRFRAACFLTVLFRIKRPVAVYFDDYLDRAVYHGIERYAAPVEIIGRMARFELEPRQIPAVDLANILELFARPQ